MAFTAKDVQNLRERTGAGMMDCKKALTASDGDFDKAVEFLREKGLAAAAKKAGRVAAEGMVYAGVCDECGVGAMVEVNSETDFVAKNEVFQKFVKDLATVVMKENPADLEALKACQYPEEGKTVAEVLTEKVATSARTSRSAVSSVSARRPRMWLICTWAARSACWLLWKFPTT